MVVSARTTTTYSPLRRDTNTTSGAVDSVWSGA